MVTSHFEVMTRIQDKNSLFARCLDLNQQAKRKRTQVSSPFLSEVELVRVQELLGKKAQFVIDGGYAQARRCRIAFLFEEEDFKSEVVCLVAKVSSKFVSLTHSDVLGALMGLNIERHQIGDIHILEDAIVVYCTRVMSEFIQAHCTQIHRLKVKFEVSLEERFATQKFETIMINVASLRIDNVVSSLVPCSRKEATMYIKSQKVSINHEVIEDSSKLCHNNDVISISRCGRFQLVDEGKTSRKDRCILEAKKYL